MKIDETTDFKEISQALIVQYPEYPACWYGKVPKRVKLAKDIKSKDENGEKQINKAKGEEFYCSVLADGKVGIIVEDDGIISLDPYDFEILEWHETTDEIPQAKITFNIQLNSDKLTDKMRKTLQEREIDPEKVALISVTDGYTVNRLLCIAPGHEPIHFTFEDE